MDQYPPYDPEVDVRTDADNPDEQFERLHHAASVWADELGLDHYDLEKKVTTIARSMNSPTGRSIDADRVASAALAEVA